MNPLNAHEWKWNDYGKNNHRNNKSINRRHIKDDNVINNREHIKQVDAPVISESWTEHLKEKSSTKGDGEDDDGRVPGVDAFPKEELEEEVKGSESDVIVDVVIEGVLSTNQRQVIAEKSAHEQQTEKQPSHQVTLPTVRI